ncbi:hypothetical protein [Pseudokineococcus sp. 1T1Z-3]|uniref:hypothetical protein n=1 Tax=Pseudokineococcus sp. 1T1Z-3 TaxID=3132745 RepID=UPI0030B36958
MSTSTDTHARPQTSAPTKPPGLGHLAGVELRKAVDTRAGFWLLVVVVLVSLAVVAVQVLAGGDQAGDYAFWLVLQQTPAGFLVPVIAILVVTSEWSARTATGTFTLVPRRQRVLTAKLLAVLVLTVAAFAVSVAVTAAGTAAGAAVQDVPADWDVQWWQVLQPFVLLLVSVLVGFALALLLLSSPVAIVLYFVVPTAVTLLLLFVGPLQDVAPWVDFSTALTPVGQGLQMGAPEWARLATASAIWVLVPSVLGALRVHRAEIG